MRKNDLLPIIMLLISVCGFAVFYLFPFLASFFYALFDNPLNMKFVGLKNFFDLFHNAFFMRGLKNTALFMLVSIPLNIALSLTVALIICKLTRYANIFSLAFLIPLVIPSATMAFFWDNVFSSRGVLNKALLNLGAEGADWLDGKYSLFVMVFIFIWKNIGYNMALFISGINNIPHEYRECASLEGAGAFWKFRKVTLVYLTPITFLALIMTFVNSFKVFREIYIITGQYPNESLYVLQHYMNNMFLSLNYSRLVSAIYILTFIVIIFLTFIYKLENRASKNLIP